ncbi:hypothetical protein BJ508DRAFT_303333 [Ascobolus immersus RN42]|uniref:Ribosome biogenesis protein SLX9 n=1 Tax=Ascobolus immersus RN42 TaxID=1160509 RepID=A0A3N4IFK7_ASCIM|nr:hypothetical protein BJ508DRAFT_303333 [Ascobolus immersus RN42]
MAPSTKRKTARSKAAAAPARPSITEDDAATTALPTHIIQPTKKAKREAKRVGFLSKVAKKTPTHMKNINRRKNRAARDNLKTTLESLADALPEFGEEESTMVSASSKDALAQIRAKKSIKSQPGAMKKKEKVVKEEIKRFNQNLGAITTGEQAGGLKPWQALRNFIGQTLEQKEEFKVQAKEEAKAKENTMEVDI